MVIGLIAFLNILYFVWSFLVLFGGLMVLCVGGWAGLFGWLGERLGGWL